VLRRSLVVFDYYVGNLTTGSPTFTSAGFAEALGSADFLDLSVCLDRVTGTGGFDLFVEHSSEGSLYATANSQATVLGAGDATFAPNTLSTTAPNYAFAKAGYKFPLMAFVRLRISLGNAGTHAHIYIVAQMRDREKDHTGQRHQHAGEHLRPTRGVDKQARKSAITGITSDLEAVLPTKHIGKSQTQ
jgi:hypothetical protein